MKENRNKQLKYLLNIKRYLDVNRYVVSVYGHAGLYRLGYIHLGYVAERFGYVEEV